MSNMMIRIHKFLQDNRGANLVEYIILVGVIALIAIAGFKIFGEKVDKKVQEQASKVEQIGN
jgi:pilus assembly protein Flp/PilA